MVQVVQSLRYVQAVTGMMRFQSFNRFTPFQLFAGFARDGEDFYDSGILEVSKRCLKASVDSPSRR